MWTKAWRDQIWEELKQHWDVVVIGGGITGAGIFREAVNAGLRTVLVEAQDFSYGTSSRSSKLIHGGFRYMRNRQFHITYESVREREWMLREAEQLVTPLRFLLPNYEAYHTPNWQFGLGVVLYDLFALKWKHHKLSLEKVQKQMPFLNVYGFLGAHDYFDAGVDDSRLVLRILQETVRDGGTALNYARVEKILKDQTGRVRGVGLVDTSGERQREIEIQADVVVNAAGPWGDEVRAQMGAEPRLRKLRGSHLVLPCSKLPLPHGVTLMHPHDRRAMFAFPWEGVAIIGTTDLDHKVSLDEPRASEEEIEYLLIALQATFPDLGLQRVDVLCTFSGLRPIVSIGAADPSKESRAHVVWEEDGLFTITGGKITTFRIMGRDLLQAVRSQVRGMPHFPTGKRIFAPLPAVEEISNLDTSTLLYLSGRYGWAAAQLCCEMGEEERSHIEELPSIWGELRWAARQEGVIHLDDLLLRRVRLGLQLPEGAKAYLPRIRSLTQSELGWSDARWEKEEERYMRIWQEQYSPKPSQSIYSNQ